MPRYRHQAPGAVPVPAAHSAWSHSDACLVLEVLLEELNAIRQAVGLSARTAEDIHATCDRVRHVQQYVTTDGNAA